MAGYGGFRPGSGRKPRAVKYVRPVNAAEKQIVDKLPQLVAAHLKLALGQIIVREETDDPEAPDIYALAPSEKALEYLQNRIMGKPIERHEVDADLTGEVALVAELDEATRARVRAALVGEVQAPPPAN